MQRSDSVASNGLQVGTRAVTFVAVKPILRIRLMVGNHRLVAMDFCQHRGGSNRDAVSVCFCPGHHPQGVGKVGGQKVMGTIEEENRTPHRNTLAGKHSKSLHHSESQCPLDSVLINDIRRRFAQRMLRERLTKHFGQRSTSFFGDRLRVMKAFWPGLSLGCPHHKTRHYRSGQRPATNLIAPNHAAKALSNQVVFLLKRGLYSGNGSASFSVTPINVSG